MASVALTLRRHWMCVVLGVLQSFQNELGAAGIMLQQIVQRGARRDPQAKDGLSSTRAHVACMSSRERR